MPPPHPDAVADCVLAAFRALPAKCKPRGLTDGRREWVPLAGIVLSRDNHASPSTRPTTAHSPGYEPNLTCAALATGSKCLPSAKLPLAKGNVLHDWHAEILAIRAFNRWLVDECRELARKGREAQGEWVRWCGDVERQGSDAEHIRREKQEGGRQKVLSDRPPNSEGEKEDDNDYQAQPFSLHDNITIHLYISDAPCGDASMELTMSAQPDATPWTTQPADDAMPGRGNFDLLGVVRRKPARPDAPPTLSKSCSDKLAMKQCTGLLSGVASLLVHPGNVYLRSVVVPEERYVVSAMGRAFGAEGRMAGVAMVGKEWRGGYGFTPFEVRTTRRVFEYSKPAAATTGHEGDVLGSNISTLSTLSGRLEVLINGVLQGRKQSDPKGASSASRRKIWESVQSVLTAARFDRGTMHTEAAGTYANLKVCPALQSRERVKQDVRDLALKGWKRNTGDVEWRLGE